MKKKNKKYKAEYRMLDEPDIKEMYGDITAISIAQAVDFAEKLLIKDGVPFESFEITKVYEAQQGDKKEVRIKCYNCGAVFTKLINRIGVHKHKCPTCELFGFIKIRKHTSAGYIYYNKKHTLKKPKSKIKIAQINCDWKEDFSIREINRLFKQIGPNPKGYAYDQNVVDSKVMFISSVTLNQKQLDALWKAGDLVTGAKTFWEGNTVNHILKQLEEYVEKEIEEVEGDRRNAKKS